MHPDTRPLLLEVRGRVLFLLEFLADRHREDELRAHGHRDELPIRVREGDVASRHPDAAPGSAARPARVARRIQELVRFGQIECQVHARFGGGIVPPEWCDRGDQCVSPGPESEVFVRDDEILVRRHREGPPHILIPAGRVQLLIHAVRAQLREADFVPVLRAQQGGLALDVWRVREGAISIWRELREVDRARLEGPDERGFVRELLHVQIVDFRRPEVVVRVLVEQQRLRVLPSAPDGRVRVKRTGTDRVQVQEAPLGRLGRDPLPLRLLDDGDEHDLARSERPIEVHGDLRGRSDDRAAPGRLVGRTSYNSVDVRLERPEMKEVLDVVVDREGNVICGKIRPVGPFYTLADRVRPVPAGQVTACVRGDVGDRMSVLVERKQIVVDEAVQFVRRVVQTPERIQIVDGFQEPHVKVDLCGSCVRGDARR